jgi:GAF domain-containing protein
VVDRGVILTQLALKVADTPADEPFVRRLCQACVEILDVHGVALTVGYTTDERVTVCTTDATSARLEDLQEVLGEGPGRDASTGGQRVTALLPSDADGRWPMLSDAVRGHLGPVQVLALPLSVGADPVGVLTAYRDRTFPEDEQDVAQFVADAIGAAIARDHEEAAEAPGEPWLARSRVHMATGMVVAQLRVPAEDALAIIRAYAFAHDKSLNQVAEDIVNRDIRLDSGSEGEVTP